MNPPNCEINNNNRKFKDMHRKPHKSTKQVTQQQKKNNDNKN